jgi:TorA maturation chaperone TorD
MQEPRSGSVSLPEGEAPAREWPRSRTFGLLAGMYLCRPSREAIEAWRSLFGANVPEPLRELQWALFAIDVWNETVLEELLWEFTRLFIGPYRLPAPPWESVYASSKRLLMQEAYDAVLECYGDAGVAVADPDVLADHVGAQMNFLAVLYERVESGTGSGNDLEMVDRFLAEHVARWVPTFARDLEKGAEKDLYRSLAAATRAVIESMILR